MHITHNIMSNFNTFVGLLLNIWNGNRNRKGGITFHFFYLSLINIMIRFRNNGTVKTLLWISRRFFCRKTKLVLLTSVCLWFDLTTLSYNIFYGMKLTLVITKAVNIILADIVKRPLFTLAILNFVVF